jgi:hypothetical protein
LGLGLLLGVQVRAQSQSLRLEESRRDVGRESSALDAPFSQTTARSLLDQPAAAARLSRRDEFGEQQIIQRRAHVEPWTASAGIDLSYTDNAGLTHTHQVGDWYARYGMAARYTNRITDPFFVDLSLEQYFFRYGRFDILDFDLTRFEATILANTHILGDTFAYLRYRLERLTEPGLGSALLTEHTVEAGLQKTWKISRGQQIFGGMTASVPADIDPRGAARYEYSISVGHVLRLTERITSSVSYRGAWYDYEHGGRSDWNHIFAAGVTYEIADWLRVGLNFAYTRNESNKTFADYHSAVPGGGVAVRIAF